MSTYYDYSQNEMVTNQLWEISGSPILAFSQGTSSNGYTGSFIKTGGQFVETASLTYTLKASYTSQTVSARTFREVGPIATFSPLDVINTVGWFSAATTAYSSSYSASIDGSPVDTWKNVLSTVSCSDCTTTFGNTPVFRTNVINGLPAIEFSSSFISRMGSTANIPQPITFYYVFKLNRTGSIGDYQVLSDGNSNRIWFANYFVNGGHRSWDMYANSSDIDINVDDDLNWHVIRLTYSGPTSQYTFDSKSLNTAVGDPGTSGWQGYRYLGAHRGNSNFLDGYIAEIVVCSGSISTINHNSMMDYLGTKYGITIAN